MPDAYFRLEVEALKQQADAENLNRSVGDSVKEDSQRMFKNSNQQMTEQGQQFNRSIDAQAQAVNQGLEKGEKPLTLEAIKNTGDRLGKTGRWAADLFND